MYSIEMCVLWAKETVCYCFGEILSRNQQWSLTRKTMREEKGLKFRLWDEMVTSRFGNGLWLTQKMTDEFTESVFDSKRGQLFSKNSAGP